MTPRPRSRRVHVGARLPVDLVARVDERLESWRQSMPDVELTRTDLLQILLEAGLKHPDGVPPRRTGTRD